MTELELAFLEELKNKQSTQALEKLFEQPIGAWSESFIKREYNENDQSYLSCYPKAELFKLRLAIEKYLHYSSMASLYEVEQEILDLIKGKPPAFQREHHLGKKELGTFILPNIKQLVQQIYSSEEPSLIGLFRNFFPLPPLGLFQRDSAPHYVQEQHAEMIRTMKKLDLKKLEPFIIKVQRQIRMKKREKEEINRFIQMEHLESKDFIDASTPYMPQCEPALAARISTAAKKVRAFNQVKHITHRKALLSILDDAFYGRKTLLNFYLDFTPAALNQCDILNGDADVVCLGPNLIDPRASGAIEIEFNLDKLIKNKPSAFFKQRDLEFHAIQGKPHVRQVNLGHTPLLFDHTGLPRGLGHSDRSYLHLYVRDLSYAEDRRLQNVANIPKSMLIAYNIKHIHEILTLNFFRFIDNMTDLHHNRDQKFIQQFYTEIGKLSDDEMVAFLTDLEKNFTDTAEFNFYGAHQIDFSTIVSIRDKQKQFTLNLEQFIADLNQGSLDKLADAKRNIPELFKSYRFLDYLISKVTHLDAKCHLDEARRLCETPPWISYTPLPPREEITPSCSP